MNKEVNYQNNPLHGVSLKKLLTEMTGYYGFEILFAYLNINCFKTNPSVASSVKFLKKTDWAREKVEAFYLYEFKNLPRASAEQFLLPPRDRVIPEDQITGEPAVLDLEDAERLREKRAKKAESYGRSEGHRSRSDRGAAAQRGKPSESWAKSRPAKGQDDSPRSQDSTTGGKVDPWAKFKNKDRD